MEHTPVRHAEPGRPLKIVARIRAPGGVYLPALHWRPAGEGAFRKVLMKAASGDRYEAIIPGSEVRGDIEYHLQAFDTSLLGEARSGSRQAPHLVRVARRAGVLQISGEEGALLFLDGVLVGSGRYASPVQAG